MLFNLVILLNLLISFLLKVLFILQFRLSRLFISLKSNNIFHSLMYIFLRLIHKQLSFFHQLLIIFIFLTLNIIAYKFSRQSKRNYILRSVQIVISPSTWVKVNHSFRLVDSAVDLFLSACKNQALVAYFLRREAQKFIEVDNIQCLVYFRDII